MKQLLERPEVLWILDLKQKAMGPNTRNGRDGYESRGSLLVCL